MNDTGKTGVSAMAGGATVATSPVGNSLNARVGELLQYLRDRGPVRSMGSTRDGPVTLGGATAHEIAEELGWPLDSVRPRLAALRRAGLARPTRFMRRTGAMQLNGKRRRAAVWSTERPRSPLFEGWPE